MCTEKPVLNASFQDLRLKTPYTQHEFLALNTNLSSFSKKTDAKIYLVLFTDNWLFGIHIKFILFENKTKVCKWLMLDVKTK